MAGEVVAVGREDRRIARGDLVTGPRQGRRLCRLLRGGRAERPAGPCGADDGGGGRGHSRDVLHGSGATCLSTRGRLAEGEWFLVHGGSSGIGTTAISARRSVRRPRIAGRRGRTKSAPPVSGSARPRAINYNREDFVEVCREIRARGRPPPSSTCWAATSSRAELGRGRRRGPHRADRGRCTAPPDVDFRTLMVKRLTHSGVDAAPSARRGVQGRDRRRPAGEGVGR